MIIYLLEEFLCIFEQKNLSVTSGRFDKIFGIHHTILCRPRWNSTEEWYFCFVGACEKEEISLQYKKIPRFLFSDINRFKHKKYYCSSSIFQYRIYYLKLNSCF